MIIIFSALINHIIGILFDKIEAQLHYIALQVGILIPVACYYMKNKFEGECKPPRIKFSYQNYSNCFDPGLMRYIKLAPNSPFQEVGWILEMQKQYELALCYTPPCYPWIRKRDPLLWAD